MDDSSRDARIAAIDANRDKDRVSAAYDAASLLLSTMAEINSAAHSTFAKIAKVSKQSPSLLYLRPDVDRLNSLLTTEIKDAARRVDRHQLPSISGTEARSYLEAVLWRGQGFLRIFDMHVKEANLSDGVFDENGCLNMIAGMGLSTGELWNVEMRLRDEQDKAMALLDNPTVGDESRAPVETTTSGNPAKNSQQPAAHLIDDTQSLDAETRAIAYVAKFPKLTSIEQVAELAGCTRQYLSSKKCPRFRALWNASKKLRNGSMPKGNKTKDGDVEAWE